MPSLPRVLAGIVCLASFFLPWYSLGSDVFEQNITPLMVYSAIVKGLKANIPRFNIEALTWIIAAFSAATVLLAFGYFLTSTFPYYYSDKAKNLVNAFSIFIPIMYVAAIAVALGPQFIYMEIAGMRVASVGYGAFTPIAAAIIQAYD